MTIEETRNMNRSDDRLDELIARHWQRDSAADEAVAANVLKALNAPLPRQRHSLFDRWPSLLLNRDYAPAWRRSPASRCSAAWSALPRRPFSTPRSPRCASPMPTAARSPSIPSR
jgi:hypothetical protein